MTRKLEEISSGKKEGAPAAENDATSVGGGNVAYCRGQGCRHPGEAAVPAQESTAGIREDVAAAKINLDRRLRVSTETGDDVAVTELLPHRKHPSPSSNPEPA